MALVHAHLSKRAPSSAALHCVVSWRAYCWSRYGNQASFSHNCWAVHGLFSLKPLQIGPAGSSCSNPHARGVQRGSWGSLWLA